MRGRWTVTPMGGPPMYDAVSYRFDDTDETIKT